MKDFDLRKYLAENKLLKEEIMVDTAVMVDPNNTLMSNASDEEIDYIKANITNVPKMSVEDFIDIYDEYLDRFYDEADPLDGHIKALQIHIDKGVLTREEALEALAMLQGADVEDYEDEFLAENRLLKEEMNVEIQDYVSDMYNSDVEEKEGFQSDVWSKAEYASNAYTEESVKLFLKLINHLKSVGGKDVVEGNPDIKLELLPNEDIKWSANVTFD